MSPFPYIALQLKLGFVYFFFDGQEDLSFPVFTLLDCLTDDHPCFFIRFLLLLKQFTALLAVPFMIKERRQSPGGHGARK